MHWQTLERVWLRVQSFNLNSPQQRLLELLRGHGNLALAGIWSALTVSRQGAMYLLRPLLKAGLVEKIGNKKTGRCVLRRRLRGLR